MKEHEQLRWQDTGADYYRGNKQALIAEKICKAAWFPKKLEPEWKKNGEPYLGNNGKQRLKRTYAVSNRPDVELWHRRDAQGEEFWIVRITVGDAEAKRRSQAVVARMERCAQEDGERRRKREDEAARARQAAAPTVLELRRRYPALFRIDGEIAMRDDGTRLQCLTFYARDLQVLMKYGLVTKEMLSPQHKNDASRSGNLSNGGSFYIYSGNGGSGAAYHYVTLRTEETPRERKHFPLTEARAVLNRIASVPGASA